MPSRTLRVRRWTASTNNSINQSISVLLYTVSPKNVTTLIVVNNFNLPKPILIILGTLYAETVPKINFLLNACKIFNLTLAVLLHYPRKH